MSRPLVLAALVLAGLGTPGRAHAREPSVRAEPVRTVAIAPLESEGLVAADHATLEQALRSRFEHPDVELVELEREVACDDDDCWRALGRRRGASHVVRAELVGHGRDYDARIFVIAVDDEQPTTSIDASCMICGVAELGDRLAAKAIAAREQILAGARTGTLRVIGGPEHARVSVDGQLVGRLPYAAELAAGEHELIIEAAGHTRRVQPIAIVGGVEELVEIELEPRPVPRWRQPLGWALLVGGAASLSAGAALIAIDGDPIARRCNDAGPPVIDPDGDCQWLHRSEGAGIGVAVAGAAAAGVGIALIAIDRHQRRARGLDRRGAPQVRVGLGLDRVAVELRF